MKGHKKYALIGIFLIFVLVVCSPTSALKADATDEQLKVMNEIEGTDITIGEYLQKVWPQFYDELTDEQKKKVNNWKKSWPESPGSVDKDSKASKASMSTNAYISSGTNRIIYSGDSTVHLGSGESIDYHYIEVKLKNSADQIVSSTAFSEFDGDGYVNTENTKFWLPSGYYTSNAWSYSLDPDTEDSDAACPMYYSA
jgi:hypothetical protein